MNEEQCPCENCICIAICKTKDYSDLIDQCSLVRKYLIDPRDFIIRPINHLKKVKEIIDPIFWDYEVDIRDVTRKKYSWVIEK